MLVVTSSNFVLEGDQEVIKFDKTLLSISNVVSGSTIVKANAAGQNFTTNPPASGDLERAGRLSTARPRATASRRASPWPRAPTT